MLRAGGALPWLQMAHHTLTYTHGSLACWKVDGLYSGFYLFFACLFIFPKELMHTEWQENSTAIFTMSPKWPGPSQS